MDNRRLFINNSLDKKTQSQCSRLDIPYTDPYKIQRHYGSLSSTIKPHKPFTTKKGKHIIYYLYNF